MLEEMVGRIRHRILLNYRIDADAVRRVLPPHFRPKLVAGAAIGGICQVSLEAMRPRGLPAAIGAASHNAAHRIAVLFDDAGTEREGVYIVRRDTGSPLNAWAGGRLFPGAYRRARFRVEGDARRYRVAVDDLAGGMIMRIDADLADDGVLPVGSVFPDVGAVSDFFEGGMIGWSATGRADRFDAIELRTRTWRVEPLRVARHGSGFFEDPAIFPPGSVAFDCAVVMRDVAHGWVRRETLCAARA